MKVIALALYISVVYILPIQVLLAHPTFTRRNEEKHTQPVLDLDLNKPSDTGEQTMVQTVLSTGFHALQIGVLIKRDDVLDAASKPQLADPIPLYNTPHNTPVPSTTWDTTAITGTVPSTIGTNQLTNAVWKKQLLQNLATAWRASVQAVKAGGSWAWEGIKKLWNWFFHGCGLHPEYEYRVKRLKELEAKKQYLEDRIKKAVENPLDESRPRPPLRSQSASAVSDTSTAEAEKDFALLADMIRTKPSTRPIQVLQIHDPSETISQRPGFDSHAASSNPSSIPLFAGVPTLNKEPNTSADRAPIPDRPFGVHSDGQGQVLSQFPDTKSLRNLHKMSDWLRLEAERIENDAGKKQEGAAGAAAWGAPIQKTPSTSGGNTPFFTPPEWPVDA